MKKILLCISLLFNLLLANDKLLGIENVSNKSNEINIIKYHCVNKNVIAEYINLKANKHINLPIVWTDVNINKNVNLKCEFYKKWRSNIDEK